MLNVQEAKSTPVEEYCEVVFTMLDVISPTTDPKGDNWRAVRFMIGAQFQDEFNKHTLTNCKESTNVSQNHQMVRSSEYDENQNHILTSDEPKRKKRNWSEHTSDTEDGKCVKRSDG